MWLRTIQLLFYSVFLDSFLFLLFFFFFFLLIMFCTMARPVLYRGSFELQSATRRHRCCSWKTTSVCLLFRSSCRTSSSLSASFCRDDSKYTCSMAAPAFNGKGCVAMLPKTVCMVCLGREKAFDAIAV